MLKKSILLFVLFFSFTIITAQNANWNYRVNSGNLGNKYNWIDCTDGTEITGWGDLDAGNMDDGRWNINWPFNFQIYDDNYSTSDIISVSTNGFIRFDGQADYWSWGSARDYVLDPTPSVNFGQILCYGISDVSFDDSNSRIFYKITGTAPNRILTIEFVDMGYYWAANMYGDLQVSFYETSNIIVIKAGNNNVTYEGAEIGLHSGMSPYFHYWQDVDNSSELTWIEYIPAMATSNDQTSYLRPSTSQPSNTSFPVSATGSGSAHEVLSFIVLDAGGDGEPTKISKVKIKNSHPANSADWSDCIAGVVLNDGTQDLNVGVTTIDDDYIDFIFNIDEFDVPEGGFTELNLKIYLNTNAVSEGETLQFYIDDDNHGWYHDQLGSGFLSNFGNTNDITSNIFTFEVVATQLVFTINPPSVIHQSNNISPTIKVEAQDDDGNTDNSFNGNVSITNSGNLLMSNSSISIVNGVASFSSLQFVQTGGPITLSTSNAHGLTNATSTETTVAILKVIYKDDFENTTQSQIDWTVTGSIGNVWQIGDVDGSRGPSTGHSGNSVYATSLNARYPNNSNEQLVSPIINLSGSSDPIVKFWMDFEATDADDGGTVQIRVKPDAASPWGSFITINRTDPGYSGTIPNDSDVDGLANNEDGWTGTQPSGDWTEVEIDLFNLTTTGLDAITSSSLIQVQFWFGSDNNSRGNGWHIDDFEVYYTAFPGLWKTTATSSDWSDPGNWDDNNVPNGIYVTIPDGAANYPIIDETANATNLLVKDGGEIIITSNGNLSITNNLTIGQGLSGSIEIIDGYCNVAGSLYTNTGSTTKMNGGSLEFSMWAKSSTEEFIEGTISLSSGIITSKNSIKFSDVNLNGNMTGDFIFNIEGDLIISDNVWSTPTGGTINLNGVTTATISSTNGNSITAYNLVLSNTGGVTLVNNTQIQNNLDVLESTFIEIPLGTNLLVAGNMTLHASNKERASLIGNGMVSVSGNSIVELCTSANVFQYISSPLNSTPINLFSVAPWGDYNPNFYLYNESNTDIDWMVGWENPPSGNLSVGKGYAYLLTTDYTHNLTGGNFNTGNFSIPVYNSGSNPSNSWNLIGNPYPSPINADAFISANSDANPASGILTGTLYFWDDDGSDGSNYASADYATYNRAGAVGGGNTKTVNGFISIGQAFFVKANYSGNVAFTNTMRSSTPGIFFKNKDITKPISQKILLSVTSEDNHYNETLITFMDEATNDFDNWYDGEKIIGNQNLAFYSLLNNKPMAIQSFAPINPDMDTIFNIPVGIKTSASGIFRIKLKKIEKVDARYNIYIIDKKENVIHELNEDNFFEFYCLEGTFEQRFEFILASVEINGKGLTGIETEKEQLTSIYCYNNLLNINFAEKEHENSSISIYDMIGKKVFYEEVVNSSRNKFKLYIEPGMYIAILESINSKPITKKIIVN